MKNWICDIAKIKNMRALWTQRENDTYKDNNELDADETDDPGNNSVYI